MNSIELFDNKEVNNIKEIIYNSANKFANKIAFKIKKKIGKEISYVEITYKKLLEDINNLGTGLYKKGLKGKRVAVIGKNRYEWVLTHLSCLLGGIVIIPLDKDLQLEELESSLIRSKANAVVFDKKLEDKFIKLKERNLPDLKEYIAMDSRLNDFSSLEEISSLGIEEINKGNLEYIDAEIKDEDMNILLFTSGTTSKSKAVMLSQKNIAVNIYDMLLVEDIRETDVNIAFLPFHHIFGSTCMLVMLAAGVQTVFPDGLKYIKQNLNEYKVTVFVGVPVLVEAIYKAVNKEIERKNMTNTVNFAKKVSKMLLKFNIDVRRKLFKKIIDALGGGLRFIICGGAATDKKIVEGFNSLGIQVLQGYGLTETSPVICAENPKENKPGSCGKPMRSDVIEIVNKDENEIGDIRVKGPNIMLGYYEMEEETNNVIKDGYFYTGDLGYIDKDGYLYITGRSKNMIVLKNGKKVFPEELELLVNRIDLVEESMVFGMPENDDKNDLKLSVKIKYDSEVLKEKYGDISEKELENLIWDKIKELNKTFPTYKHIRKMILTDEEFIKTTSKKIKRFEEIKKIMSK